MSSELPPQNRLALETSPYLRRHASDPVNWYPWGVEALERAAREDKPLLVSIGYAACHFSHSMQREAFANPAVAKAMNAHFVCVLVDRDQRPDLDELYLAAAQALNGTAGWPLTVFCTPEQAPFFAGTHLPATNTAGRLGFNALVERVAQMWHTDREALYRQADEVSERLRAQDRLSPAKAISSTLLERAVKHLLSAHDSEAGGFGAAPKFPQHSALLFLLRTCHDDEQLLQVVTRSLDAMKHGGIREQLSGAFFGYALDARWQLPHFEQTLSDNALFARLYTEAFQATHNPEYKQVAQAVLGFMRAKFQSASGGFCSALVADASTPEAAYFTFNTRQLRAALEPEEIRVFCAYYGVTEQGNWKQTNVLHITRDVRAVAEELRLTDDEFEVLLARARRKALALQSARPAPKPDSQIVCAFNALAISAMAEAARVFRGSEDADVYLESAERATHFALTHLTRDGVRLLRSSQVQPHRTLTAVPNTSQSAAQPPNNGNSGTLHDYAYFIDALIDVYETNGNADLLAAAQGFATTLVAEFYDRDSATFFNSSLSEELLLRRRDGADGALPNGTASAGRALLRLSRHLARPDYAELVAALVRAYAERLERSPRAHASLLNLTHDLLHAPLELLYHGDSRAELTSLETAVAKTYLPERVIHHARGPQRPAWFKPTAGGPALYICNSEHSETSLLNPAALPLALEAARVALKQSPLSSIRPAAIAGHATEAGTRRYLERHGVHPTARRALGDVSVSRVGFGGHRLNEAYASHQRALRLALVSGCNLLDTAPGYGAGASERALGNVLSELIRGEILKRDEICVVSKVGIFDGDYSLDPLRLETQLRESLARLNLSTLDVCLIHNPELLTRFQPEADLAAELARAFRWLDGVRRQGLVREFGVSSTELHLSQGSVNLDLVERARALAGVDKLRVLSLPFNVREQQATTEKVLSRATELGYSVLGQRPLDTLCNGRLERLATPPDVAAGPEFEETQQIVAQLEQEFHRQLGAVLRAVPGIELGADRFFLWSERIHAEVFRDRETWNEFEKQVLAKELPKLLGAIEVSFTGKQLATLWHPWRKRYVQAMEELVLAARRQSNASSNARNAEIFEKLRSLAPSNLKGASLSQLAIWFASSADGMCASLVGMREPEYAVEATGTLRWPDWSAPEEWDAETDEV